MNNRAHITDQEFDMILHDNLRLEETETLFQHIASCNYCSERFAVAVSGDLLKAPRNMKADLLKTVKQPDIQLEQKARETARRIKMLLYSLKIGAATVLTIALLTFTLDFTDFNDFSEALDKPMNTVTDTLENDNTETPFASVIKNQMDTLTHNMLSFSNKIMNTEVNSNDQKER